MMSKGHSQQMSKELLCHWGKLKIIDNTLYRESSETLQLVLPSKLHRLLYEELHSKMAHPGPEKVYLLAKERVLLPRIEEDSTFCHKNLQL